VRVGLKQASPGVRCCLDGKLNRRFTFLVTRRQHLTRLNRFAQAGRPSMSKEPEPLTEV
jgi:hypothetical protein